MSKHLAWPKRLAWISCIVTAVLAGLLLAGEAEAATTVGTLRVGAVVVQRCRVSAQQQASVSCARASERNVQLSRAGAPSAIVPASAAGSTLPQARHTGEVLTVHF